MNGTLNIAVENIQHFAHKFVSANPNLESPNPKCNFFQTTLKTKWKSSINGVFVNSPIFLCPTYRSKFHLWLIRSFLPNKQLCKHLAVTCKREWVWYVSRTALIIFFLFFSFFFFSFFSLLVPTYPLMNLPYNPPDVGSLVSVWWGLKYYFR